MTSDLAFLRGRLASGRQWRLARFANDSSLGIPSAPWMRELAMLRYDAWFTGPTERVVARLDSLIATPGMFTGPEIDRPYEDAADVYSWAGRPDKARALLARMRAEVRGTSLLRSWAPAVHNALGEIALAENRGDAAVSEFHAGDRLPDGPATPQPRSAEFDVARAFDVANKPDSAIAHFERYLSTPSAYEFTEDVTSVAGVYKRLGELYDDKGDRAKAELYLTKFVALWSTADPELQPKIADARGRLTRLRLRDPR